MYNVGFEPCDWYYSQSTGRLYLADSQDVRTLVGLCYSGKTGHQNKSEDEARVATGPIPRGVWRIGAGYAHKRLGRVAIPLEAADPRTALGRSGFFIHGDNSHANGSASSGCIIAAYAVRCIVDEFRRQGVRTLVVGD